jgi:hypothetical protein
VQLDPIRSLGLEELRLEWRRLYHSDVPRISRDLLVLGLGYRPQEIEQGGLGKATRRKLPLALRAKLTWFVIGPVASVFNSANGGRTSNNGDGANRDECRATADF